MGMDKPIEKKNWPPIRIIKYSAAGIFILVVAYLLIFRTGGSSLNVRKERITISKVESGPFQEFIPIIGNVLPINTFYLDAVVGGRVEKIYIRAGKQVKKGDEILTLSNTNLLMTLMNNEAQINRASNELRATRLQLEQNLLSLKRQRAEVDYFLTRIKRQFERNKILFEEKLISKQEFDELKDEYEYQTRRRTLTIESQETDMKFRKEQVLQLEKSVKRMQGNLRMVKEQLENLTVRAPITGLLTSLNAEIGESKSQGQRLGQIDETEGFKVRAQPDEHYINRVEMGKIGEFNLTGISEKTYQLRVMQVFPEVQDGRFEVDLEFVGKEPEGIKRGQSIHIRLQLSEMSQAILLARGGFYQTTGGNWAYVVDESGDFAVKKNIRLGRQNPQFFEVLEGLNPGDSVITSSYENFGDMDRLILQGE